MKTLSKNKAISLFIILVISLTSLMSFLAPASAQASSGWIMAYFTENPNNYDLHIAYSTDALHWTALNNGNPVAHPTLGYLGLRDPFILRKQDGTFVVMATNMNGTNFTQTSPSIHIWDSTDLTTFSNYRLVRMTATNMHAWAPEAFWDAGRGQYAILWSGNANYNKTYVNYTTDFINVGTEQVYFDPGFSTLDADVITGSTNYLYYKKESDNKLYGSKATSLAPGSFNSGTYTSALAGGNAIEAPELVPVGNTWYLYGDSYSPVNGKLYAWQTTSISTNSWTALSSGSYQQPPAAKHPGIVPVTAAQMTTILAFWGGGPAATPTRTNTPGGPTPTRTPTPVPGTFPVAGTQYRIINRNSGKVADVANCGTGDNVDVRQWTSLNNPCQKWTFVAVGSYYKIINVNSGKVLDVSGASTADGGNVLQFTDNGGNNQQWTITALGGGYYRIINRNSNKDLDVSNCSTADGGNIQQWTWLNNNCQQWQITP